MRKHSIHSRTSVTQDNRVRIIAGRWKGRKISFPDSDGLRPTGDRIRETLFNWLMPMLPGARCLDLFAGSGVLGLEALSRGAAHCVLVEQNPEVIRYLQGSATLLAATDATVVCGDARQWLETASDVFDLVFLDPPFADNTVDHLQLLLLLRRRELLAPGAWVYLEQPRDRLLPALPGFQLHREQCSGRIRFSLWRSVLGADSENAFDD